MSIRTERVAGVIRETITEVLACGGVKDPRVLDGGLITVTHVRVAADLGVAWVFVTSLGARGVEQTVTGLRAAAGYLRGEVGKRLHARRLPELRFEADVAAEKEARVEAAFREIEMERRAAAPPEPPAPEPGDAPPAPETEGPDGGAVPEETAFEDTERVEVPYPASIEPRPGAPK
jgi:ribosome-binding factor A